MMSKASYMMQDHLRRNFALITDIHNPNVFLVRGTLPFPQGLAVLTALFRGKLAADVYSHPYFIEKQSDPSQPSPQLHLTEECQSVMKIIKGMHFMNDTTSRLDNTVVFVSDYDVQVKATVLTYASEEDEDALLREQKRLEGESDEEWQGRLLRQRWQRSAAGRRKSGGNTGSSSFEASLRSFTRQSHHSNDGPDELGKAKRLVEREGAHTVLYNPIDVDPKTFVATINKLNDENRVVKTIVVPTRQAWGSVHAWAEAFPDAEILCSGEKPIPSGAQNRQQEVVRPTGGCMNMGNGLTGLSFPEVDEAEVAVGSAVDNDTEVAMVADDINNICRLCSSQPDSVSWRVADEEVRCSSRVQPLGTLIQKQITPNIELLRVAGDDLTNEYVMYDRNSASLACTDLFHGEYGDLDPVNSWLCRVWFKFMKQGNYKRVDRVPEFKWLQVKNHGDLKAVRESVDIITSMFPMKFLLYAHGTPPLAENPANALRLQWGMPPLS
ncbi:hypothetical protein DPX39_090020500 [Trypanosoma brucei equiperdum]|uniref:Uncharacterized protein n=1 Tax=Trypanosoma brucei equiperdum TaxID=630700 RepID=A0A3L6L6F9_9TRYP|nr:hypothetical protein DPX39_090020500 [Trypanosoma brucei equiperdum]